MINNYERNNANYYGNTLKNCYGFYTDKVNIANIGSYYSPAENKYYNI
jgi:hypothetical protein